MSGGDAIARRALIQGAVGAAAAPVLLGNAPAPARRKPAPKGFLWGAAISAHQSEGNNTNSDAWLAENIEPTLFKERSGDACDSYHRYDQDFGLAQQLGLNCYRLGIEWARIEPSEGHFSNAELDHYARVLTACRARGLAPVVTLSHFTVPLWFAKRGGFEVGISSPPSTKPISACSCRCSPSRERVQSCNGRHRRQRSPQPDRPNFRASPSPIPRLRPR